MIVDLPTPKLFGRSALFGGFIKMVTGMIRKELLLSLVIGVIGIAGSYFLFQYDRIGVPTPSTQLSSIGLNDLSNGAQTISVTSKNPIASPELAKNK